MVCTRRPIAATESAIGVGGTARLASARVFVHVVGQVKDNLLGRRENGAQVGREHEENEEVEDDENRFEIRVGAAALLRVRTRKAKHKRVVDVVDDAKDAENRHRARQVRATTINASVQRA